MARRPHRLGALVAGALLIASSADAQELGHKLLGGTGVNAGVLPRPGLYVMNRLVLYGADQVRDRNGDVIPIVGLDADVVGNVVGVAYTKRIGRSTFFGAAVGAPYAHLSIDAFHPLVAVDAAGFGDVFVQPIHLGTRFTRFDLLGSYAFYAPTGHFEPEGGGGIGRGYWTHEFTLGGALRPHPAWRASLLASYDLNRKKRGVDITRGNTIQMQGGVGTTLHGILHLGIAGFALWQVTDNEGSDLPDIARDPRTRVFGAGPEIGVTIPSIRLRVDTRYEWEFGVRSRQDGGIFVIGGTWMAWSPDRPAIPMPSVAAAGRVSIDSSR